MQVAARPKPRPIAAPGRKAGRTRAGTKGHVERPPEIILDAFLPYRFATIAHAMSRQLTRVYADAFGLSIAEWRILANLGRAAMGAGDLADASSLDKPAITRALQRLEARGLVVRETPDDDRRRARLALSKDGVVVYKAIAVKALAWEAQLLSGFSPRQQKLLAGLLDRLRHHLA